MSDDKPNEQPQPASNPSDPPSTGAAPTTTTSSNAETEPRTIQTPDKWRFPDTYEVSWMRNKTADEVARMSNQLYMSEVQRMGQPQQPMQPQIDPYQLQQPQPQQVPTYQQPIQAVQPPTQDEWLNDPAAASQKQMLYIQQTQFNPMLQQQAAQMGQLARSQVAMQEKDVFDKYGPEVDGMIGQLAPDARTVENIQHVVNIVRGRHWQDFVAQGVQAEINRLQESGTLRSSGDAAAPGPKPSNALDLNMEELPEGYRKLLERHEIDEAVLSEFLLKTECANRGITLKEAFTEWFDKAKRGDVIVERGL